MRSTAQLSSEVVRDAAFAIYAAARETDYRTYQVQVHGSRAAVIVRFDEGECRRRTDTGLTAITSPDVLRILLSLPVGESVPFAALTGADLSILRTAPQGAVRVHEGHVCRYAMPPLEVSLALVSARSWGCGLEQAGRFAPFSSRAILIQEPPRDLDDLYMVTGFYGIGVIVADGQAKPYVLVRPEDFQRKRFTAASWRFLEEIYRQISSSAVPTIDVQNASNSYPGAEGLPTA